MKRKMELAELGIPLGLVNPSSFGETAMPTKSMPPIKCFLGAYLIDLSFKYEEYRIVSYMQEH